MGPAELEAARLLPARLRLSRTATCPARTIAALFAVPGAVLPVAASLRAGAVSLLGARVAEVLSSAGS